MRSRLREGPRVASLALALVILAAGSVAAQEEPADVSGTWVLSVDLGEVGSGDATFEFSQEGSEITGTYSGALGEAKVTGTVKGNEAEFYFDNALVGRVTYKATVEGDAMEGTCSYGDFPGTFSGDRER